MIEVESQINAIVETFSSFIEKTVPYTTIDDFNISQINKGIYLIGKGMRSFYIGAFTREQNELVQSFINQLNNHRFPKVMKLIHSEDKSSLNIYLDEKEATHIRKRLGLVNRRDIHLFCGSSNIGTYRIDIINKPEI